jgi:beta-glucosidase
VICRAWPEDDNFEGNYVSQYETAEVELVAGEPVEFVVEYQKRAARGAVRMEWQVPGAIDRLKQATDAAAEADVVIVCAGLSNLHEGGSRDRVNLDLPEQQIRLIEEITKVNPKTEVALFNGGPLVMPWEKDVPALLEAWYPGQEGGRALARILFGEVNPSGRLPDTLAHRLADHASAAHYPGNGREVVYAEGLSVGYRHFDSAKIEPHYPFGFGLSYTRFEISAAACSTDRLSEGDDLTVRVRLKNVGKRDGATVVQVYVRPIAPPVWRPEKELKAFAKVSLSAGEATEVELQLSWRDFAYFDVESNDWRVAPGSYDILVGEHSRSLVATRVDVGN